MSIVKDFKNGTVLSWNFLKFQLNAINMTSPSIENISGYFQNLSGQGSEQHHLTLKLALLTVGGLIGSGLHGFIFSKFLYYCEDSVSTIKIPLL